MKKCPSLRPEQYAALNVTQLREARLNILERKRERAGWEAIAISYHARDGLLRTKEAELEKTRDQYRAIAKSAEKSPPETTVARLIAQAAFEEYIRGDIENLKNAKKVMEMLDEQLQFCDTALQSKDKRSQLDR